MGVQEIQIGLSGSFTLNELKRELEKTLIDSSGSVSNVTIGQFNNFAASMADSAFFNCDVLDIEFHIYFLEDIFPLQFERLLSGENVDQDFLLLSIDQSIMGLVARSKSVNTRIVLCLDSRLTLSTIDFVNFQKKKRVSAFLAKMNVRIETQIANSQNISFFQINDLVRKHEFGLNLDWRKEFLFRNPLSLELSRDLAFSLSTIARNVKVSRTLKVLAVDCDNTLWGGVIGEDGLENIQLGEDFPGRCYRQFQLELLNLKNSGFLLCLLSKNNLNEVEAVFNSHDGMVLKWEDVTAFRVNWESKSLNMVSLAKELNLSVDSFVFVDDSSLEIEEMRLALPSVNSLQVPADLEEFPAIFQGMSALNPLSITVEDVDRSKMMKAERVRADLSDNFDESDFLAQLDLELILSVFEPQDLERVSQLVAKTNQFNLTTKRFSLAELSSFLTSPIKSAVVGRLRDRFGEYGLIGVVFFEDLSSDSIKVSNFLVSCRALGRGIEMPMLSNSISKFLGKNQSVYIERTPNDRNIPAMHFLEKFDLIGDAAIQNWDARVKDEGQHTSRLKLRWME